MVLGYLTVRVNLFTSFVLQDVNQVDLPFWCNNVFRILTGGSES